jgi:hypothetical protein
MSAFDPKRTFVRHETLIGSPVLGLAGSAVAKASRTIRRGPRRKVQMAKEDGRQGGGRGVVERRSDHLDVGRPRQSAPKN